MQCFTVLKPFFMLHLQLNPEASVSVLFPPYDSDDEEAATMIPIAPAIRMTGQEERQGEAMGPIDSSQGTT